MIFVDTNVLIDVLAPGQAWRDWSMERIEALGGENTLVINHIVFAELAGAFSTFDEATAWLARLDVEIRVLEDEPAFASGLAFRRYRQAGQDRSSILSDFLIGGHALYLGAALLTRDSAIYRAHFPDLTLITPETHP